MNIGRGKSTRRTYGFDEIALVPGSMTIDPELCDISIQLGPHKLSMPIIASAMDSVVDVRTAGELGRLGALGVLNLQGLQTRYDNPDQAFADVVGCDNNNFVQIMQKLYMAPVQEKLVAQRVAEIKKTGALVSVSVTPNFAERFPGRSRSRMRHSGRSVDGNRY